MRAFGLTDVGLKRKINQDAFLCRPDIGLFVVADGMGGHRGGEVASQLAIDTIESSMEGALASQHSAENTPRSLLQAAITQAGSAIYEKARHDEDLAGMGTTVVAALVQGNKVTLAQVGDSRIYLGQRPHLWQITEDHSLMNEELRAGRLLPQDLLNYQFKNVITRSVGYEPRVAADFYERQKQEQDIFVMCSDGLSGLVPTEDIAKTLFSAPLEQAVMELVHLANARGGDDNITVVAFQA